MRVHPQTALRGERSFGHIPAQGTSDADDARARTRRFREAVAGGGLAQRVWWGAGSRATALWAAREGMNLMSWTLRPRTPACPSTSSKQSRSTCPGRSWARSGWEHEPRVSVSRSVIPITTDTDRAYFGHDVGSDDQVGHLDGGRARFGRTYAGDPDVVAVQLAADAAVQAADTLLVTVPNMLGVDDNVHLLESIAAHVAPALGWSSALARA